MRTSVVDSLTGLTAAWDAGADGGKKGKDLTAMSKSAWKKGGSGWATPDAAPKPAPKRKTATVKEINQVCMSATGAGSRDSGFCQSVCSDGLFSDARHIVPRFAKSRVWD